MAFYYSSSLVITVPAIALNDTHLYREKIESICSDLNVAEFQQT